MHIVSIDWLTISVDCSNFAINANYSVERVAYGTSIFADMLNIGMDSKPIAILTLHPRMKHMDPNLGLLKILNPILYLPNLDRIVNNILFDFRLGFKGISRLDLCADFNSFYHDFKIVSCEDSAARSARLALTAATSRVLKTAMELICLATPEKI